MSNINQDINHPNTETLPPTTTGNESSQGTNTQTTTTQSSQTKRKRVAKPLPDFLQPITLLNLPEYDIQSEKEPFTDDNGNITQEDHAVIVVKGENHQDLRQLTLDQLRKLCAAIGIKKSNLTKKLTRYWIAHTARQLGALGSAATYRGRAPSTHCRMINAVLHRDNVEEFLSYNTARGRATHKTGSGGQFQRFWKKIATWVNEGYNSSTPEEATQQVPIGVVQDTQSTIQQNSIENSTHMSVEEISNEHVSEIQESQESSNNSSGTNSLANAEDSLELLATLATTDSWNNKPNNDKEVIAHAINTEDLAEDTHEIGSLFVKNDPSPEDPYNNHIGQAIADGIDPAKTNTRVVTEKDVKHIILDLIKVRKEVKGCMQESGNHSSDPMDFVSAGMKRAKVSNLQKFTCYYFFMRAEDVPNFDFNFASGIHTDFAMDSGVIAMSDISTPTNLKSKVNTNTDTDANTAAVDAAKEILATAAKMQEKSDEVQDEKKIDLKSKNITELQKQYKNFRKFLSTETVPSKKIRLQKKIDKLEEELGLKGDESDDEM